MTPQELCGQHPAPSLASCTPAGLAACCCGPTRAPGPTRLRDTLRWGARSRQAAHPMAGSPCRCCSQSPSQARPNHGTKTGTTAQALQEDAKGNESASARPLGTRSNSRGLKEAAPGGPRPQKKGGPQRRKGSPGKKGQLPAGEQRTQGWGGRAGGCPHPPTQQRDRRAGGCPNPWVPSAHSRAAPRALRARHGHGWARLGSAGHEGSLTCMVAVQSGARPVPVQPRPVPVQPRPVPSRLG